MIKNQLVKIKEHPPYLGDMEGKVLLNSMARATLDIKTGEYSFRGKLASEVPVNKANVKAVEEIFAANGLSPHTECLSRFINTTAGWINLLLLSSSGSVKIPIGAWYVFSNPALKKSADTVSPVQPRFNPSKSPPILFFMGRARS